MIRAVLVDDDIVGQKNLSVLIDSYCSNISIVGTAVSVCDAERVIHDNNPDVVFLDINMPAANGFDLLKKMQILPMIVFVTAYSQYAIQALKANAVDYILKPIDIDELMHCEQKLVNIIYQKKAATVQKAMGKLKIHDCNGVHFINTDDIIYLEAQSNYTIVHCQNKESDRRLVVSKTLGYFASLLPTEFFFRIHNSYIINIKKIRHITKKGNSFVVENNYMKLLVSRRKSSDFKRFINEQYGRPI